MTETWDHVARRLLEWRRDADDPSYTEIARRISEGRAAEGCSPAAARVGRTTVYDAFRLGRARINISLVREIGLALGVEENEIRQLLDSPPTPSAAETTSVPGSDSVPEPPLEPAPPGPAEPRRALLLMGACVALNLLGREFVDWIGVPLYLDMVGTALAAVVLGPWRGAGVGAATNLLGYFTTGWISIPFLMVNVVGALVWGYGVHRFDLGRTLVRFFALTLAAAVACTVVAVPIVYLFLDGSAGQNQSSVTANIEALGVSSVVATWAGNLLTSVEDKMISAFVALVGASLLGHSIAGLMPPSAVSQQRARRDATTA